MRVVWLAWCQSEALPTQIADDADRSVAKPEDAIRAIEASAERMRIKLTEHANVMRRLKQALDHVTHQLDAAQARGDLSWFDQAYRQWRIRAKQFGLWVPYQEARARLRKLLSSERWWAIFRVLLPASCYRRSPHH